MERAKRAIGRPAGREYPVIKQVRLGADDAAKLSAVAHAWRCSEAAAIRRAIQEAARREEVDEARSSREPARLPALTAEERRARVNAAFGAAAHLPGSVDEFLRRKQEEIELEEKIWERRRSGGAA